MYAILADDLTGAADTGVEFARAGWRTRALGPRWLPADLAGAEVVVIDPRRATRPGSCSTNVRRTHPTSSHRQTRCRHTIRTRVTPGTS